jgi:hypothetical protein
VVLDKAQKQRLTTWMQEHLLLGWAVCQSKDDVDELERRWIAGPQPSLHTDGAGHGSRLTGLKQVFREDLLRRF